MSCLCRRVEKRAMGEREREEKEKETKIEGEVGREE